MPIMGGIEACQKIVQVYRDYQESQFKKVPLNDDLLSIKRQKEGIQKKMKEVTDVFSARM